MKKIIYILIVLFILSSCSKKENSTSQTIQQNGTEVSQENVLSDTVGNREQQTYNEDCDSDDYIDSLMYFDNVFKYLSFVCLDEKEVAHIPSSELRIMRNAIFAMHHYKFKSKDLQQYFGQFDWYRPETTDVSEIELTDIEKHNIDVIKRYEGKNNNLTQADEIDYFLKQIDSEMPTYFMYKIFHVVSWDSPPDFLSVVKTAKFDNYYFFIINSGISQKVSCAYNCKLPFIYIFSPDGELIQKINVDVCDSINIIDAGREMKIKVVKSVYEEGYKNPDTGESGDIHLKDDITIFNVEVVNGKLQINKFLKSRVYDEPDTLWSY